MEIIIESPYSGDIEANIAYLEKCMADSYFTRDEAPIATHLLWTRLSPDPKTTTYVPDTEDGRKRALEKCRQLRKKVGRVAFYTDKGWSNGMKQARKECEEDGIPWEERSLEEESEDTKYLKRLLEASTKEFNKEFDAIERFGRLLDRMDKKKKSTSR
jgi:hypothetical protein